MVQLSTFIIAFGLAGSALGAPTTKRQTPDLENPIDQIFGPFASPEEKRQTVQDVIDNIKTFEKKAKRQTPDLENTLDQIFGPVESAEKKRQTPDLENVVDQIFGPAKRQDDSEDEKTVIEKIFTVPGTPPANSRKTKRQDDSEDEKSLIEKIFTVPGTPPPE